MLIARLIVLFSVIVVVGCHTGDTVGVHHETARESGRGSGWREIVRERLTRYGHRNVIAVVDSAYPSQSKAGIEMVVTDASQLEVVEFVLQCVSEQRHVRAKIVTDVELAHVSESDAPGIGDYRNRLSAMFKGQRVERVLRNQLIRELHETADVFNVLLLKTDMVLPHASVFVHLECGYWSDEAEARLREGM